MPKAERPSTTGRAPTPRPLARKRLARLICRAESRLHSLASDWEAGTPGDVRFELHEIVKTLRAALLRERQHYAEAYGTPADRHGRRPCNARGTIKRRAA